MADETFRYTAFDADGKTHTGTLQARSEDQAMEQLSRQGLTASSVKAVATGDTGGASTSGKLRAVSDEELASFAYELSALIQAGVSLAPALELLVKDDESSAISAVTLALLRDVRAGTRFSEALERYPDTFPPIFAALVRAGEGNGNMHRSLGQISEYLEQADEARNKIMSSLAYPTIVCGMAFTIITALFLFMVPRLRAIYEQLGVPIPPFTAGLLELGSIADGLAILVLVVGFLGFPTLRTFLRSQKGQRMLDSLKLKLPVLGSVFREIALASFNKTLALLHDSGIVLHEGVRLAAAASGNHEMQRLFESAVGPLREGRPLASVLGSLNVCSQKMLGMIEAGEKSGNLSEMLAKMAEFSENRVRHRVDRLMSLLEPLTIGFLGVMVGAAVIVLGAPLMNLSSSIR